MAFEAGDLFMLCRPMVLTEGLHDQPAGGIVHAPAAAGVNENPAFRLVEEAVRTTDEQHHGVVCMAV